MNMKLNHLSIRTLVIVPLVAFGLSACEAGFEGTKRYKGATSAIAVPRDKGIDQAFLKSRSTLEDGVGGIVYDPDGCQGWLIDDGIEGYSGRRFDPVSGLPVCNNLYPPGTVIGNYSTRTQGVRDYVPGRLVRGGHLGQTGN
jgi:hypothetical protein